MSGEKLYQSPSFALSSGPGDTQVDQYVSTSYIRTCYIDIIFKEGYMMVLYIYMVRLLLSKEV